MQRYAAHHAGLNNGVRIKLMNPSMIASKPTNDYLLLRNGQLEKANIENEAMIRELLSERDSLLIVVKTYEDDERKRGLQ